METADKILEALRQHVQGPIRPAGNNNVIMRCPFHDDHSPSFAMSLTTGLYICYACGVSGNFRQFLYNVGMSREEIHYHYNLTLKNLQESSPPPPDPTDATGIVAEDSESLPEELLGVFHQCPVPLLDEGLHEDVLDLFEVGVDKAHSRITFPLRDLHGKLMGISGRAIGSKNLARCRRYGELPSGDGPPAKDKLDKNISKYKVYEREYLKWDLPARNTSKSNYLWNAHRVYQRAATRLGTPTVIVEGFKACMWLYQAGVTNVVALMTKSMSREQRWILQRVGGPYVLMLDGDDAGIDGTLAICENLSEFSSSVRIVDYDAKQPTDVPLQEIRSLVANSINFNELLFR